jgi:hypothetical protein
MAIKTNNLRVLNALNTKNESNLYICLCQSTVWNDEANPPNPLVTDKIIDDIIYAKKISIKHLVVQDDPYDAYGIDVQVKGVNWNYVLDAEAFVKFAHYLYLSVTVDFNDISPSNVTFRQIAIIRNPKDVDGNLLTDVEYLGTSIIDQGELLYIDNFVAISRSPDQTDEVSIVLNF